MTWKTALATWDLSRRALIMGVLNVTPDSFSDGGRYVDPASAAAHARQMWEEGADLVDVGGESTRPGAEPVDAEEEARRVLPAVAAVARAVPGIRISVDTRRAAVADAALEAGACVVNDVTGLRGDPAMAEVVRRRGAGAVIMHMQGDPRTMQRSPRYDDVTAEVAAFFRERLAAAVAAGIPAECLAFDPGIGFGKTPGHNLALCRDLPRLAAAVPGRPLAVGVSRKSFLARVQGRDPAAEPAAARDAATVVFSALLRRAGARVLRVHRVGPNREAVRLAEAWEEAEPAPAARLSPGAGRGPVGGG